MKSLLFSVFFLLVAGPCISLLAQVHSNQDFNHPIDRSDSVTDLKHFFSKGHFHGHARSYWMMTDNKIGLSDSYAWGIGAGMGYETPRILKHFQVGLSGFFMGNLTSSDLVAVDTKTKQNNRYEIGLFDVTQPTRTRDLNRMEELYLRYYFGKKSKITLGRQLPKSPFINLQDGRMSSTYVEGLVVEWSEWKNTKIQAEYLYRISPRSTVSWYNIGESMGVYPVGLDVEGKPSGYAGSIQSKGIFIGGLTQNAGAFTFQLWDTYVENVFNTAFLQTEWKSTFKDKKGWIVGVQVVSQQVVGEGGNPEKAKVYFPANGKSAVFSGRVGYRSPKWDLNLNTTRITAEGRYLMPREWGREPFYTFLPRERNEGVGDTKAFLNQYFL